jgi:hypothetical protein
VSRDERPITESEKRRAERFGAYFIVWYEDRFSREDPAYPMRYYLSREEADADAGEQNRRLGAGSFERYDVTGPSALADDIERGMLAPADAREALAALEAAANRKS